MSLSLHGPGRGVADPIRLLSWNTRVDQIQSWCAENSERADSYSSELTLPYARRILSLRLSLCGKPDTNQRQMQGSAMRADESPSQRSNLPSYQANVLQQLVSDQELFENVVQVLPKLRGISVQADFYGANWRAKPRISGRGVDIFEYDASSSRGDFSRARSSSSAASAAAGTWPWSRRSSSWSRGSTSSRQTDSRWPNADVGVPYAAVAHCDLDCHVNEALEILFSSETIQYESSMRALWGKKFKRGDQLRSQAFKGDLRSMLPSDRTDWDAGENPNDLTQPGWIAVTTTSLAPKNSLSITGKHEQRLCFTTYTQKSTTKNEAVFLMRTLPKEVHDQIVERSGRSALRGGIDHIAVGYHLVGRYNEITGHRTRMVMCAYVSTSSGNETPEVMHWRVGRNDANDQGNAEAKHIVMMLAKATIDFEKIIRRRRLGLQSFAFATTGRGNSIEPSCAVCGKDFGFLRRDRFCRLCGHMVCRSCSRRYEVEAIAGRVRKTRICFACASRVESCVLNTHGDVSEKKSTVSAWCETVEEADDEDDDHYRFHHQEFDRTLDVPVDALESPKAGHQLAEALFSPHPLDRARALEVVRKAVQQVTQEKTDHTKPLDPVLVHKYLEVKHRLTRISSKHFSFEATDSGRSFPVFCQRPLLSGFADRRLSDESPLRFELCDPFEFE